MGDETSTSVPAQEQEPAVVSIDLLSRQSSDDWIPYLLCFPLLNFGLTVQGAGSVKQQLSKLVVSSLRATVPEVEVEPMVEVSAKFADYQWYVVGVLLYLIHQ